MKRVYQLSTLLCWPIPMVQSQTKCRPTRKQCIYTLPINLVCSINSRCVSISSKAYLCSNSYLLPPSSVSVFHRPNTTKRTSSSVLLPSLFFHSFCDFFFSSNCCCCCLLLLLEIYRHKSSSQYITLIYIIGNTHIVLAILITSEDSLFEAFGLQRFT